MFKNNDMFRCLAWLMLAVFGCQTNELRFIHWHELPSPRHVSVSIENTSGQLMLSWQIETNNNNLTYQVYRKLVHRLTATSLDTASNIGSAGGPVNQQQLELVGTTNTTTFKEILTTPAIYIYQVAALQNGSEGPKSQPVQVHYLGPYIAPALNNNNTSNGGSSGSSSSSSTSSGSPGGSSGGSTACLSAQQWFAQKAQGRACQSFTEYFSPGSDSVWRNSDDPVGTLTYSIYQTPLTNSPLDLSLRLPLYQVNYTYPGTDQLWGSSDDIASSLLWAAAETNYINYVRSDLTVEPCLQTHSFIPANYVHAATKATNIIDLIFVTAAGADFDWFTGDDLADFRIRMYNNALGDYPLTATAQTLHNGKLSDWLTATAAITQASVQLYYAAVGYVTAAVSITDPGPDELWFTADDYGFNLTCTVNARQFAEHCYTTDITNQAVLARTAIAYDASGRITEVSRFATGSDNTLGTSDDQLESIVVYGYSCP